MTRRLGTIVALLALAATASADKAPAKKPAPKAGAKSDDKKPAPPTDPAAGSADGSGSAADPDADLPPHIKGPKLVDLGSNVEIDVPAGMILLEHAEAKKLVEQSGGSGDSTLAVVVKLDAKWWMSIEYSDVGYVSDDDSDKLDADGLLKSFKDGISEQNVRRREMGKSDLILDGWSEMPRYDKGPHHLVWGIKAHSDLGVSVNYFTRVLGRNGYLSVDLITSPDNIDAAKVESLEALNAIRFRAGARYEEHKSGDKDSGIGLRALVLGGAGIAALKVAKVGFFAAFFGKIALFFKAGFKLIAAAVVGFFAWIKRGFKRKPKDEPMVPPSDPNSPPPVG